MAPPPLARSAANGRHVTNGTGRREPSSSVPQTLTQKLAQELGPQADAPSRHTRPHAVLAPSDRFATNSPHASGPHGFYRDADEDGEERMPIPSTWRSPSVDAPAGWLARQLKAGLLGLILGLAAVVPAVFWLTGRLDGGVGGLQTSSVGDSGPGRSSSEPALATGEASPLLLAAPTPAARPAATERDGATGSADELLSRAQGYIGEGNMVRAREILSESVLADNPQAAFALAETFDPNILAATGALGARAEVERARMLYGKALAGGIAAARRRLDALN
jgi:hypothetical protein